MTATETQVNLDQHKNTVTIYVASSDATDYNDEYYYTTEGKDIIGLYGSESEAWEAVQAYFRTSCDYLASSVEQYLLSDFWTSDPNRGPQPEPHWEVPDGYKDEFLAWLSTQWGNVNRYEVDLLLPFEYEKRLQEAMVDAGERLKGRLGELIGEGA